MSDKTKFTVTYTNPRCIHPLDRFKIQRTVILLDVLFDVLMLWFQGANHSRPMYLFGRIGLLVLLIDIAAGSWLLWQRIYQAEPLTERPMFFVVVVLFFAALFMLAMGFVLELLSDAVSGIGAARPYVVRERVGQQQSIR